MLALIDTCLANSSSGGTDKLVLLILARSANPRGYTRLPVRLLALLSGRADQTVRESLARLCTSGDIARVEQGGGKAKATTYQIMVKRVKELPDLKIPDHDHNWTDATPR